MSTNKAPTPKQDPGRKAAVDAAYNLAFGDREDIGDDEATLRVIDESKQRRQARAVEYHKQQKAAQQRAASGTAAPVKTK